MSATAILAALLYAAIADDEADVETRCWLCWIAMHDEDPPPLFERHA